jgi:hypothetical protein
MKKKATKRKVIVRNKPFIVAIGESFSERPARHKKITGQVKNSGILATLMEANKKESRKNQ